METNDPLSSVIGFDPTGPAEETQLRPSDLKLCLKGLPPGVFETIKDRKCCVAGGYIRDTVGGIDKPKDIDIFTDSEESARIIAGRLFDRADFARFKRKIETGKAVTVLNGYRGPAPQVIFKWVFEDMSKVIDAFDFTCSQAALWWDGTKFVTRCHPFFYRDLDRRALVFTSPATNDTLGTLLRVLKFYRDGYSIDNDNLSMVVADICYDFGSRFNELELESIQNSINTRLPNRGDGRY